MLRQGRLEESQTDVENLKCKISRLENELSNAKELRRKNAVEINDGVVANNQMKEKYTIEIITLQQCNADMQEKENKLIQERDKYVITRCSLQ